MPLVHLLLLHAATVYSEDTASLHAWNCSQCVLPEMRGFHLFQIIVEPTARLQAYVGWDPPSRLIVVAFRGTCTSSLRNWIADLEALPRSLSYPGLRHARVHRGFYSAYHFTRLRPAVVHAVLFLMTILPGSFRVAFTGHSLGGALATLSALDLQVSYDLPSPVIQVVTFGSPRVGNAAFAAYFRQKLPKSTRVTNWKDLVPHLPPATIGYHHVATEAWIIPDSVHNVSFSPSSSALPTQKGRSGSVSLPHLLRQRRSAWGVPGECLGSAWGVPGECLGSAWGVPGECLGSAWGVPGECLGSAWGVPGECLGSAWGVPGECLGSAWGVPGECLGSAWGVPGECLGSAWGVPGECLGSAWGVPGECLGSAWGVPGECLGSAWGVPGECLGSAWGVPGECLGSAWGVPGECLGSAWGVPGECLGSAWGVPGECLGVPSHDTAPHSVPFPSPPLQLSVVGDSIANHLEYLGVPLHSGHSSSDT
ncbi:unnamed protein product [Closterium sp. NIES-65]|nr:unnamed protein product [Closterium sp. NIES-65]